MVVYAGRRFPGSASTMSRIEHSPLAHKTSMIWNSRFVNFGAVSYLRRKRYYRSSRKSRAGCGRCGSNARSAVFGLPHRGSLDRNSRTKSTSDCREFPCLGHVVKIIGGLVLLVCQIRHKLDIWNGLIFRVLGIELGENIRVRAQVRIADIVLLVCISRCFSLQ